MCVLRLHYSENLLNFFGVFFPIVNFDFLPSDQIYEYIFRISEQDDKAKTDNFEMIGYGSSLVFGNLGSLPLYQIAAWLVLALAFLIIKCCPSDLLGNSVIRRLKKW